MIYVPTSRKFKTSGKLYLLDNLMSGVLPPSPAAKSHEDRQDDRCQDPVQVGIYKITQHLARIDLHSDLALDHLQVFLLIGFFIGVATRH